MPRLGVPSVAAAKSDARGERPWARSHARMDSAILSAVQHRWRRRGSGKPATASIESKPPGNRCLTGCPSGTVRVRPIRGSGAPCLVVSSPLLRGGRRQLAVPASGSAHAASDQAALARVHTGEGNRVPPWSRTTQSSRRAQAAVASLDRTRMIGASGSCGCGIAARLNSAIASRRKTRQWVEPPN